MLAPRFRHLLHGQLAPAFDERLRCQQAELGVIRAPAGSLAKVGSNAVSQLVFRLPGGVAEGIADRQAAHDAARLVNKPLPVPKYLFP
ncbi:hypothetical protein SDC9_198136 [bioreactor metagenome]|uniref:Uncharacterized protein n=1 Tax=bioreactor metagenome TaxID=1076179 RepID=A0A645IJ51_9ZZZZ